MSAFSPRAKTFIALAAIAAGLVAPLAVYPVFLMKMLCFMLFASAFNLMIGYAGLLGFGHAMFFGGAGYIAGYCLKFAGWPLELALVAAVVVSAFLGLIMGIIAIGKQGIYFSMITLALAQMFYFICAQAPQTGGENGISAIPRGTLLGVIDMRSDLALYYFVFAIFMAASFFIYRTIHSPFGHVLRGIRDNEPRAISLGYDVERFKLIAFVISAAMTGLAGALKAVVLQLVTLVDVSWMTSGEAILMTLVGGIGTIAGPMVGAAFIITMQNYLTGFAEWVITIQGVIFFFVVLLFRRGIVGELQHYLTKRRKQAAENASRPQ